MYRRRRLDVVRRVRYGQSNITVTLQVVIRARDIIWLQNSPNMLSLCKILGPPLIIIITLLTPKMYQCFFFQSPICMSKRIQSRWVTTEEMLHCCPYNFPWAVAVRPAASYN